MGILFVTVIAIIFCVIGHERDMLRNFKRDGKIFGFTIEIEDGKIIDKLK